MIETKKTVTSITIKGEESISLLFTALCFIIDNCKNGKIGIVEAEEVLELCNEIRDSIQQ